MPKGKYYRPYRLPGMYPCYVCRDLKDAEEFYKDASRWNGCSSRCKGCCNKRREARREGVRESVRQIRKRVLEIKALETELRAKVSTQPTGCVDTSLSTEPTPRWTEAEKAILKNAVRLGQSAADIHHQFSHKTMAMLQGKLSSMKGVKSASQKKSARRVKKRHGFYPCV